jgi:hypothetical protein
MKQVKNLFGDLIVHIKVKGGNGNIMEGVPCPRSTVHMYEIVTMKSSCIFNVFELKNKI